MPQSPKSRTPIAFAQRKMMDMLSRREHSEAELRAKLTEVLRKHFRDHVADMPQVPQSELESAVDSAVQLAGERGWLIAPSELSTKKAADLHKKLKGILYINQYLESKGLPEVSANEDLELEKAHALVKNKTFNNDKARAARLLEARGFDEETVRKVLHEKF